MTDAERIDRLERMVTDLCMALRRKGTMQDGAWGFPSFHDEMVRIAADLDPQPEPLDDEQEVDKSEG